MGFLQRIKRKGIIKNTVPDWNKWTRVVHGVFLAYRSSWGLVVVWYRKPGCECVLVSCCTSSLSLFIPWQASPSGPAEGLSVWHSVAVRDGGFDSHTEVWTWLLMHKRALCKPAGSLLKSGLEKADKYLRIYNYKFGLYFFLPLIRSTLLCKLELCMLLCINGLHVFKAILWSHLLSATD